MIYVPNKIVYLVRNIIAELLPRKPQVEAVDGGFSEIEKRAFKRFRRNGRRNTCNFIDHFETPTNTEASLALESK